MLNETICKQKIKIVVDKGDDRTKSIIAWLNRIEKSGCTIAEPGWPLENAPPVAG